MKKFAIALLGLIIVFCATPFTFAAQWSEVSQDDECIDYVDLSSLQYKDGVIGCWEKEVFRNKKVAKRVAEEFALKETAAYVIYYTEYNVKDRTCRYLDALYYDYYDALIDRDNSPSAPFERIVPDSIEEACFNAYKERLKIK